MTKQKPLLPTLKEKKRYLAIEIISDKKVDDFSKVKRAIFDAIISFVGELGLSRMGLIFLTNKWNKDSQRAIVRVERSSLDEFRASLCLLKEIDGVPVIIKGLKASGMINKLDFIVA